ncbi:PREDICTED: uncharacterized protein LOC105146172 [Acromyrmex echinatior]|uniref:uncharacterized protein LOC105146171 n=1 Tax=Acromyrmex echinatior TaxID=103372 RepID=UPI000580FC63|nr:PREDICTED: uncharacterized protein LOC105146171 [Acromyrmex echinatior]XP_011054557.1 PREDICTED: uncharacterized protein LOC105146172 [Acromyrmex echinatior]
MAVSSTATKAGREETPPPSLPAGDFHYQVVSIWFIFLSEEASIKCAPGSELEDDEEEGEGRELDSIEGGESLCDILDLTMAYISPARYRELVPLTWDRENAIYGETRQRRAQK